MKRVLCSLFILAFLLPASVWAGSIKCSRYQIHLEGASNKIPGHEYKEVVEMHKVGSSSGYDGQWKVDRIVQIVLYPSGGPSLPAVATKVPFPNGQWMMCTAHFINNMMVTDCSGGEMYLDVSNNRIGSKKTNIWQGKIQGRKVTYKFDPNNTLEPALTGEVREPNRAQLSLSIASSIACPEDKYVYSDSDPGILEMEFTATVTPSQYEQEVEWSVPEIEGATRTYDPPSGKGPRLKVRYEGLPKDNAQFGLKTVHAVVNVGGCQVEDSTTVKLFYPRDATNNPGGEFPNWFYYWKQTPAGRPKGQNVRLLYGGRTVDLCAQGNFLGQYIPGHGHATIHVCDLTKLGPDFETKYPELSLKPPYYKGLLSTKHIDTFAVAVRHEFEHWQINFNYRNNRPDLLILPSDTDGDGLPDRVEPQFGFDFKKEQTHLANHPEVKKVGGDEEWLCYMSMLDIKIGSLDKYDWARPGKQWP
jgi:hypothetical protein